MTQIEYLERTLDLVKEDLCSILVSKETGETRLFFICNDLFAWGCADAEEIAPEDLDLLGELYHDNEKVETGYIPEMFCCKKRGMRPQAAYYKGCPESVVKFFDSCGPERTDEFR